MRGRWPGWVSIALTGAASLLLWAGVFLFTRWSLLAVASLPLRPRG